MENNNVVSIIVPVFNADLYLSNCIESILNQTYKNIEVILINDGSTDNSGMICDGYAKKDFRVKVIHQSNAGVSCSRNKGIKAASGTFIQFVDSDDYIEPNMTNKLLKEMKENVQLVICGYKTVYRKDSITKRITPTIAGIYQKPEFLQHFGRLYMNTIVVSPCNKLFRTEIINTYNIRFKETLSIGEDLLYNLEYIGVCNRINIIHDQLYNYLTYHNANSLTRNFRGDLFENHQMLLQKVKDFLVENNCYFGENEYIMKLMWTNNIVKSIGNTFHEQSSFTSKQKKKQIAEIVADENVQRNITYFQDNMQKRFVGHMIKHKNVEGIYWFFKARNVFKKKAPFFFNVLKRINNKF